MSITAWTASATALPKSLPNGLVLRQQPRTAGTLFDPIIGVQLIVGSRKKVSHVDHKRKGRSSAVWNKLYTAGMRLMGIIERSRDCKSKELAVLTNRINALCDKQEKEIKNDSTR